MRIFSGFLAKQVLLTLLQLILFSFLLLQAFSAYLKDTHQQKSAVVEQLVAHHVSNDPKLLARQLLNALNFDALSIDTLEGAKVFTNVEPVQQQPISAALLNAYGTLPLQGELINQDLNLKLYFEVSLTDELALLDKLIAMLWAVSIALSLLHYFVMRYSINSIFKKASTNIAHAIADFAADQNSKESFDFQAIPSNFSEVIQAIKTLGTVVDEQNVDLQDSVQQSHSPAKQDELTGLPSRTRFVQYFEEHLGTDKSPNSGCLAIVRCTELQEINHTRGYHEGDKYVTEIVEIISKVSSNYYNRQIYRLNGCDFALVLPSQSLKEGERLGQNLQNKFNEYQKLNEIDSVGYTGIIHYKPGKPLGELLAMADTAISIAQTRQTNAWHAHQESDLSEQVGASYGTQNWRQVVDEVINQKRVALLTQEIEPCNRTAKCYAEILTRFKTAQGQILPTASFLAMAEKLDKIVEVDRMIIDFFLQMLQSRPQDNQIFGINITAKSVHDEKFINWLERRLKQDNRIGSSLVFEVSEQGLQQNIKASKRFIDILHQCGARITVERFGVGLTSFKFFRDLKPDFIKMDGSYTRGIDEDQNNQYFLRLMIDLAHRISVGVIAEGVETEAEKETLQKLTIDGVQGYFVGKPEQF